MNSKIAILDIETGTVETVLRSEAHLEAPNFLPGDDALLVNSERPALPQSRSTAPG